MGFDTFATSLRSQIITDALGWAGDFLPLIALITGLMAFGVTVAIIRKFV